jgi:hypothetical protein
MCSKIQFHHIIILQNSLVTSIWSPVSCDPKNWISLSVCEWNEDIFKMNQAGELLIILKTRSSDWAVQHLNNKNGMKNWKHDRCISYQWKRNTRITYQFKEHPVGKAMPACSPFSLISFLTMFSSVSHRSIINIPGLIMLLIYFRT